MSVLLALETAQWVWNIHLDWGRTGDENVEMYVFVVLISPFLFTEVRVTPVIPCVFKPFSISEMELKESSRLPY